MRQHLLRQPAQPPRGQHRGDRSPRRARLHPHHRSRLPPRTTLRHHHRRRDHGPALHRKLGRAPAPATAGSHEPAPIPGYPPNSLDGKPWPSSRSRRPSRNVTIRSRRQLHIPADFVCRKSVGRGPFRLCGSSGSAHLLEGLRCDGRFIPDGRGAIRGTVALHVGDHAQGSDVPVAECGHIGIKRHRCAAPWRAPPPGYAPGRPPGTGAPMPGCGHRSTGLIHSADGAARGDLGLQDGRRRLVEVVVWLRRKPGHPPAFGPSARARWERSAHRPCPGWPARPAARLGSWRNPPPARQRKTAPARRRTRGAGRAGHRPGRRAAARRS